MNPNLNDSLLLANMLARNLDQLKDTLELLQQHLALQGAVTPRRETKPQTVFLRRVK